MPGDWRMRAMCANCPFRTDGNAIELRPGRLERIKEAVALSQPFTCHKWIDEPRSKRPECSGAIEYRETFYRENGAEGISRLFTKLFEEVRAGKWDGGYG